MRRLIAIASIAVVLSIGGCGWGSPATTAATVMPTGSNAAMITVDAGPSTASGIASINTPFVSVTICAPGSASNCQTIDHVEVDTGSYGLRLLSSVVDSTLALQQEMDTSGGAIVECTVFADGFSWGPVKAADIQIAGEAAAAVPIQIIGDPAFAGVPAACSSTGPAEDTVATFGANGILGVGPFVQDDSGNYYTCTSGVCNPTSIGIALEVSNPVAFFAADNNGVIVELPAVAAGGSAPLTGSLVFGIGTETNNGLGNAKIYGVDPSLGEFTVTYKTQAYPQSFIDSGSNANYFVDSTIAPCSSTAPGAGFFCPTATLSLSATVTGTNNASDTIAFSVGNAQDLFNNNTAAVAFAELGAPSAQSNSFDWGLPFFFGRNVYTAIANSNTPGGIGPYVAF